MGSSLSVQRIVPGTCHMDTSRCGSRRLAQWEGILGRFTDSKAVQQGSRKNTMVWVMLSISYFRARSPAMSSLALISALHPLVLL